MDRERGLWDAFDTQELYGVRYGMDKAARLHHRQTMMTHAMLFTGVDVVDGQPNAGGLRALGATEMASKATTR